MKNGKRGSGPWRGLTSVTASLLALMLGAISIVNTNAAIINTRLGTTNYVSVDTGDGEEIDSNYYKSEFDSLADLVEAKNELAEQISEEGSVLLKNEDDTLPIDSASETVTLWGLNSHNPTLGGQIGSTASVNSDAGQISYNIELALETKGFTLNEDMISLYSSDEVNGTYGRKNGHGVQPSFGMMYENFSGYSLGEAPASIYTDDVLESADDTVALVVISRDSSEANDYYPDMENSTEGDSFERPLALSENEKAMIELAKEHSTRVIVMINAVNPVEIDDLKNDDEIGAILWVGEPGVNGFLGVADVLSGEENPSGHLSDTYAVNSTSSPSMVNYGVYLYTNSSQSSAGDLSEDNKGDWYLVESEGIYTGYKYYETRYEDLILGQGNADAEEGSSTGDAWSYEDEVSYSFGYGLSYTTFEQTLDSVELEIGGTGTATVTVTNTGDVAGKSVVQLYVQTPYTEGGVEKSAIQLVSFAKTSELEPGDSETVTIEFDPSYFASYDETAEKEDGTVGAWVLEEGDYYFAIGNGAHEALNNVLANKTGSEDDLVTTADTDVINADNVVVWTLDETDIETYSEGVENQLQDCDINNLVEDTVEYTTRSDWTKGWTPVEELTATDEMLVNLTNQIYEFTENGDGVTWGADNGLTILDMLQFDEDGNYIGVLDIDDPTWDLLVQEITLDEAIQFIEKGGDDVEDIASISLLRTYANDGPVGFAYDQVAGYYVRWTSDLSAEEGYTTEDDECGTYSMATMPTEPVVAATFNTELVEREGELFGEDGIWSNESSLFAPGTNLHRSPYCARNHEYYSEDSMLVSLMSCAVCKGGESKGLMMEAKHFAFNHQEANRSGLSTFFNEQGAREGELRCFQYIMSENLTAGVMTAFNRAGTTYVGAYSNLLINIARNEWGYIGWFNTDMINGADYMNWRDIVAAGGGSALTTSAYDTSNIGAMSASKSTIEKDTYFQEMMQYNIKFWLYQLADSNSMNGQTATTQLQYVLTWYQKALYGVSIGLGVLTAVFAIMGLLRLNKNKKSAKSGK